MHMYTFNAHKEAANGDGFNYPIDVYYGTIYLGTLLVEPDGFVIRLVDTPTNKQLVKTGGNNKFKSQNLAAATLHRVWKKFRYGGDEEGETVPV